MNDTDRVRLALVAGASCVDKYEGAFVGVTAQQALSGLHFVSAGAVCFARALNDTPKIVGILIGAKAVGANVGLGSVGLAMALGGLLGARKVAETMSKKIATLNAGQGFVANLTTAVLVIAASRFGLPVSTTHVATGGLFGIGAVTGTARWKTIVTILLAWLTTLPLGAALGAGSMLIARG
jgi:PiT family inorganic phosphate transporter